MNCNGRDIRWWHPLAALFIIFFGVPSLIVFARSFTDAGESQFTRKEEEIRRSIGPLLDSLVIDKGQLGRLSGDFHDCSDTFEENTRLAYDFGPDRNQEGAHL